MTRCDVAESARLAALTIALLHACALNQSCAFSTARISSRNPVMPPARPGSQPMTSTMPVSMRRRYCSVVQQRSPVAIRLVQWLRIWRNPWTSQGSSGSSIQRRPYSSHFFVSFTA